MPTALGKQEWNAYKIAFFIYKQLARITANFKDFALFPFIVIVE